MGWQVLTVEWEGVPGWVPSLTDFHPCRHPDPTLVYPIQPVRRSCWLQLQNSSESEDFLSPLSLQPDLSLSHLQPYHCPDLLNSLPDPLPQGILSRAGSLAL